MITPDRHLDGVTQKRMRHIRLIFQDATWVGSRHRRSFVHRIVQHGQALTRLGNRAGDSPTLLFGVTPWSERNRLTEGQIQPVPSPSVFSPGRMVRCGVCGLGQCV